MPAKVVDLDLSEEISPIWGVENYDHLYILVRHHGRPIGWISAPNSGPWQPLFSPERLRAIIVEQLGSDLLRVVLGGQFSSAAFSKVPSVPISVVICTRDRTFLLGRCLRSLLALDYPNYEVIVVDNAPPNDDTAELVAHLPVRYVREEQPGQNWARNRGIAEAQNEIVAFIDDDVIVDRLWLRFIAQAFAAPEVMAATGLIAPAELETQAQILFEFAYGGTGHGLRRRVVRQDGLKARDLLWASSFGGGANMAFRRHLFAAVGPFDVALDVSRPSGGLLSIGRPSGGGGDIEMFHRVVASGHTLVYEPAALVWHTHKRDLGSLRSTIYDNGGAFGTYLLTCARNRTVRWRSILRFALREWLGGWILPRFRNPRGLPRRLVALELVGALLSPLTYIAAQKRASQTAARLGGTAAAVPSQPESDA